MHSSFPIRAVAACFALAAFAVAIVSGLASGREADSILQDAIVALTVCQFVGLAAGYALRIAMSERLAAHRAEHEKLLHEIGAPVSG